MSPDSTPFFMLHLLVLPLLAAIGIGLGGKRFGDAAGWVASAVTLMGLLYTAFFLSPDPIQVFRYEWATLGDFTLQLSFRLDYLSWLMLLLVHFVALLVQLYSIAYMRHDPARARYFAFIQLFIFSMLGIVLAGSLLVMYIFWELVGLSSYLLIGFWYHKPRATWAAKKAFILNRIGDAAFLSGILLLLYTTGTTDFTELVTLSVGEGPFPLSTAIGLLLFGGCVGKSAQFPLSAWLPDAMEGPTPVSALIHAATMVAAGIFLLARIAFLLAPTAQLVIAIIGTITMLHGAWRAMNAWDIKQLLAHSTISQLGLMVLAVGVGSWQVAMFHLFTHAFFKAGLFLSAGSVIHALHSHHPTFDPQNMRNMGGLRTVMPRTFLCFVVCAAALAGLPLFSGFLSKDAIFVTAFARAAEVGGVWYVFPMAAIVAAGLTAYYMMRQVWLVFMGQKRYTVIPDVQPHESPALMWGPMATLAAGSLFFWFSFHPLDGFGGWFLQNLDFVPDVHISWVPLVSVIATGVALALVYRQLRRTEGFFEKTVFERYADRYPGWRNTYGRFRPLAAHDEATQQTTFFLVLFQKIANSLAAFEKQVVDWLIDALARATVVAAHVIGWADRFVVDGGVRLVAGSARGAGRLVRALQNGKTQSYFMLTFVGMLLLLVWMLSIN